MKNHRNTLTDSNARTAADPSGVISKWKAMRSSISDETYVLPSVRRFISNLANLLRGLRYIVFLPLTILSIMIAELVVGSQTLSTVIKFGVDISLFNISIAIPPWLICILLELILISLQTVPWDLLFRQKHGGLVMNCVFGLVVILSAICNVAFLPVVMHGQLDGRIIPSDVGGMYIPSAILVFGFTVFANWVIAGLIRALSEREPLQALGNPAMQEICLTIAALLVSAIRAVIMIAGLIGLSIVTWLLLDASIRLNWPDAGDTVPALFSTAVVAVELQMAREISRGRIVKPGHVVVLAVMSITFGVFAVSAVPHLMLGASAAAPFLMPGTHGFQPLYVVICAVVFLLVVLNQYLMYWYQASLGNSIAGANGEKSLSGDPRGLLADFFDDDGVAD